MERIYDTRPYRFVNCADIVNCGNQVGPFIYDTIKYPIYCADCKERMLLEEEEKED